ncbi:hypothetical protein EV182_008350, partial [Spiromyces aspiralis]
MPETSFYVISGKRIANGIPAIPADYWKAGPCSLCGSSEGAMLPSTGVSDCSLPLRPSLTQQQQQQQLAQLTTQGHSQPLPVIYTSYFVRQATTANMVRRGDSIGSPTRTPPAAHRGQSDNFSLTSGTTPPAALVNGNANDRNDAAP